MITFAPKGYRLACCTGNEVGTADFDKAIAERGHVLLPGLTHLRSISSPARHWGDC